MKRVVLMVSVLALMLVGRGAVMPAGAADSGVKALAEQYVEILNSGDTSKVDEILAAVVVTQGDEVQLRGEIKQRLANERAAREANFSEWRFVLTRLIAEGDTAAFELEFVATTLAGKKVSVPVMVFVKAKDGKLVEIDALVDNDGLRKQLAD